MEIIDVAFKIGAIVNHMGFSAHFSIVVSTFLRMILSPMISQTLKKSYMLISGGIFLKVKPLIFLIDPDFICMLCYL